MNLLKDVLVGTFQFSQKTSAPRLSDADGRNDRNQQTTERSELNAHPLSGRKKALASPPPIMLDEMEKAAM